MNTVPPRRLLLLAIGFLLWAGALMTLYGVHALGCAFGWPPLVLRGVLVALLVSFVVALGWLSLRRWRHWRAQRDGRWPVAAFIEYLGLGLALAALASTLLTLAPSFALRLCA